MNVDTGQIGADLAYLADLAEVARGFGLGKEADAVDAARRRYAKAQRAVEAAELKLAAFGATTAGVWFRSLDRERRGHVERVAAALVRRLAARHAAERAGEIAAVACRAAARLVEARLPSDRGGQASGGSPPGGGLTRDDIIDAAIENREPNGTWPTQTTVSLALGKDEGARRIRQVQGPRGWAGILEDARAKLANR